MIRQVFVCTWLVSAFLPAAPAVADPGLYIGGSFGGSDLKFAVDDPLSGDPFPINDDQVAWKLFGGYRFDTQNVDLAIEGGYSKLTDGEFVDLFPFFSITDVELDAWPVVGLIGVNAGPVGIFGKAGVVFWDTTATVSGIGSIDDSGSDLAYGAGLRARWGAAEFRIEYENFQVDAADDIYMTSFGFVWNF